MSLSRVAFWGMTRSKGWIVRRLLKYAHQYIDCYHDYSYKMRKNGERRLLDIAASQNAKIIFDVGANVGEWSLLAQKRFPNASIHAFELSAVTHRTLCSRLTDTRFVLNNLALSDSEGELKYADRGPNSGHNSIIPGVAPEGAVMSTARSTTGDLYCEMGSIDVIDFLKIDVEGAEHLVLSGFDLPLNCHPAAIRASAVSVTP